VRIEIEPADLPLAPGVAEVAEHVGMEPAQLAATAGEDYELCACVPAAALPALGELVTVVGRVLDGDDSEPGVTVAGGSAAPWSLRGHEHRVG
jgi:thiamine-monophosphate kinase